VADTADAPVRFLTNQVWMSALARVCAFAFAVAAPFGAGGVVRPGLAVTCDGNVMDV
jgi:hypothetical protein